MLSARSYSRPASWRHPFFSPTHILRWRHPFLRQPFFSRSELLDSAKEQRSAISQRRHVVVATQPLLLREFTLPTRFYLGTQEENKGRYDEFVTNSSESVRRSTRKLPHSTFVKQWSHSARRAGPNNTSCLFLEWREAPPYQRTRDHISGERALTARLERVIIRAGAGGECGAGSVPVFIFWF